MTVNHPLVGKRVRLVQCNDRYTKLQPGTEGTVLFVDDTGTIHVAWDTGSKLGLVPDDGDSFEVMK